jgi:hypothetical protein
LLVSAASGLADAYADEGTIYITGTITSIENQQTCDRYDCHLGSTFTLAMTFLAPDWNAPDSHYMFSSLMLSCIGGPPCFTGYQASSDFGWAPYGFDILYADIEDGNVVDARVGTGGYFIEWGQDNRWSFVDAFSGTTTGYAVATPEPAGIVTFVSGIFLVGIKRIIRIR